MRRFAAATTLVLALLAPATALAAPAPVDRYRSSDGVALSLSALARLTSDGETRFTFTAEPPAGDRGRYSVDVPAVPLAAKRALTVGTAIACGSRSATVVYGTVRSRARRVVATTTDGETIRLRRVQAPERWDFDGRVVGRVLGGEASVVRVEALARGGRRIAVARFAEPPACPRD